MSTNVSELVQCKYLTKSIYLKAYGLLAFVA